MQVLSRVQTIAQQRLTTKRAPRNANPGMRIASDIAAEDRDARVLADPPYQSESSGALEARFERLVKEQHMVEAARYVIIFITGDYECLKRMVREEFNQGLIGLSGALVNQYLKADHEMLRRDIDRTLIERKHLERPLGPRLLCQRESGLRAVDAQISL